MRGEYPGAGWCWPMRLELPPRARRILLPSAPPHAWLRNYLRVRGEYSRSAFNWGDTAELPPRARRILNAELNGSGDPGTTSACAENTACSRSLAANIRNYLRVRGEYLCLTMRGLASVELPPRARRIHDPRFAVGASPGTTSACAENTNKNERDRGVPRNYLRVRGEYYPGGASPVSSPELPPRARRIQASNT